MKENFYKTFANLPISERRNPIYVDQKYGAMSWFVVWLEVKGDTEIGIQALESLTKNNLI